jgi:flagellar protein FliT
MAKTISDCIDDIYHKNLNLLEMVREERWDDFVGLAEQYVLTLQEVFARHPEEFAEQDKDMLRTLIPSLQDNEKEMTERLRTRMVSLRKDMSALHHGNKCSQLYSSQFLSVKTSLH